MYELKPFREVKNQQFKFHKLTVDNRCLFDEFENSLCQPSDIKALGAIYSLMECFGNLLLPKTKFNHIVGGKKDPGNVFEFKKNNIRVYIMMQKPDVIVILGGFKTAQKKDIEKVFSIVKDWIKETER